jgi:predicted membrane protein (TIGR00267 family)
MRIRKYFKILKDEEIARRYFVMNSFDGALTILGVVIGMYVAGIEEARIVIVSCLGAAIAMAVSGIWGAYAAERAERVRALRELERHMLMDLGETRVGRRVHMISFLIALVDGLSPMLVSLILIFPFFISQLGGYSIEYAFGSSIVLVLVVLFLLGAFVGRIGKDNLVKSGVKMVLAGILVGVIVFSLEGLKFD